MQVTFKAFDVVYLLHEMA